jgi:hypothetical protein
MHPGAQRFFRGQTRYAGASAVPGSVALPARMAARNAATDILIGALGARSGVTPRAVGKTVWAELDIR